MLRSGRYFWRSVGRWRTYPRLLDYKSGNRHLASDVSKAEAKKGKLSDDSIIDSGSKTQNVENSSLSFAYRREGEVFGQLVNEAINGRNPLHNTRVVTMEEAEIGVDPKYKNPQTGEILVGATSRESRLNPKTLRGRVNHTPIAIPKDISKCIQNNLLYAYIPSMLKHNVAQYYLSLDEKQLQNPVKTEQEADVSIAATFAQNYGIAFQVLDELRRRVGKEGSFHPKSVLSCASGPATGMLALNELMGENFNPEVKDVLIHGDFHMMRRAKLLLSRQLCEYLPRGESATLGEGVGDEEDEEDEEVEEVEEEVEQEVEEEVNQEVKEKDKDKEIMNVEKDENSDQRGYVGKVKTKDIHIKSILMDKFRPISRKYDLIIAERELLRDKANFPHEIDRNLDEYVERLNPGGYLVILERGNPLGAEVIARARQLMLRPENFKNHLAKIARPYKRFSETLKEVIAESGKSSRAYHKLLKEVGPEYVEALEEKREIEPGEVPEEVPENSINLEVVAPCPHFGMCPLQYSKPEVFGFGGIGKKLKFCSFMTHVQRPRYLLELKRGAKLATKWTSPTSGIAIKGKATPGGGRPFGRDTEKASFAYLIVKRSEKSDRELLESRNAETGVRNIGYKAQSISECPRILAPPKKKKHLVIMDMCAPSGHIEKWHVPRSVGKDVYHDATKAKMGDIWSLGAKSIIQSRKENVFYLEKLNAKDRRLRRLKKRDSERLERKIKSDYRQALDIEPAANDLGAAVSKMASMDSYSLISKPKERKKIRSSK